MLYPGLREQDLKHNWLQLIGSLQLQHWSMIYVIDCDNEHPFLRRLGLITTPTWRTLSGCTSVRFSKNAPFVTIVNHPDIRDFDCSQGWLDRAIRILDDMLNLHRAESVALCPPWNWQHTSIQDLQDGRHCVDNLAQQLSSSDRTVDVLSPY